MAALFAGALALVPFQAGAYAFIYNFDDNFTGVDPAGPRPWNSALFQDIVPGSISLTLSNNNLSASEYVAEVYINLNPLYDPTTLTFSLVSGTPDVAVQMIETGVDSFKADGDGKYDVRFTFGFAAGSRFEAGDFLQFNIGGIAGLNVNDFNYFSAPAGGKGPWLAAAHIRGITDSIDPLTSSAWVRPTELTPFDPIPEPATGTLLALAAGLWLLRRK